MTIPPRCEQVAEALADLEEVFFNPGCFGDCTLSDVCESLASEFVGAWRDDEIVRRLSLMADSSDRPKQARHHLTFVRRKIRSRWAIVPTPSVPVIPDAAARRWARSAGAKAQVGASHDRSGSPQAPVGGDRDGTGAQRKPDHKFAGPGVMTPDPRPRPSARRSSPRTGSHSSGPGRGRSNPDERNPTHES